jgi:hypothetical protein
MCIDTLDKGDNDDNDDYDDDNNNNNNNNMYRHKLNVECMIKPVILGVNGLVTERLK